MTSYKVFSASVIGSSHVKTNLPCHDAHLVRLFNDDKSLIACISDGMGSAKKAQIGSALSTECLVDYLQDNLDPTSDDDTIIETIKTGFFEVHKRLEEEAEIESIDIKDLNATLMVFIAVDDERQFVAQVGDCVTIALDDETDEYSIIIHPQKGEYANQTYSICNKESIENGAYYKLEKPYKKIAMMSDGIESFTIDTATEKVSKGFFDPFFNAFDKEHFTEENASLSLSKFLNTERINKKTDDDKTLVFIKILS